MAGLDPLRKPQKEDMSNFSEQGVGEEVSLQTNREVLNVFKICYMNQRINKISYLNNKAFKRERAECSSRWK